MPEPNPYSLFMSPVTETEICNIVKLFKNNKAPGLDEFSPRIIKTVIDSICKPLCHIFNLSLSTGNFPDNMKVARVTPIFKSGDKEQVSNYRPISVLSTFSKILERIIYKRTYNFLEEHNCLFANQFGFRRDHSTQLSLLELTNKVIDAFEDSSFAIGVFIDLSKAFDTVNHDILLSKLKYYGIRGIAHDLFSSYLKNRRQCTVFNSKMSDFKNITCGVPQGSLLGPLLFILFVNDIYRSSSILSFVLYADDTNILYSHKNMETLSRTVNTELSKVCTWFAANKLTINQNKCNYMIFYNSPRPPEHYNSVVIRLNNHTLPRVESAKFLGTILDSKLSWKQHINALESKIAQNTGLIYRLSMFLPERILRTLYCSLILPYLSYCNIIWANTYPTSLTKLCALQNKAVRTITRSQPSDKSDPLYKSQKLLYIDDINKVQQCSLLYKCLNSLLPAQFCNKFLHVSDRHKYNTRSGNDIFIPNHRTRIFQNNILFTGPKHWNELPKSLQTSPYLSSFTRNLKKLLISKYKSNDKS